MAKNKQKRTYYIYTNVINHSVGFIDTRFFFKGLKIKYTKRRKKDGQKQ